MFRGCSRPPDRRQGPQRRRYNERLGRCSVSTNIASSAPLASQVSSVSLSHPASRAPVRRQVALLCQSPDFFANSRGSTSGSICAPPRAPPQGLAHGSKAAAGYTVLRMAFRHCGMLWPPDSARSYRACYGLRRPWTLCHGLRCRSEMFAQMRLGRPHRTER